MIVIGFSSILYRLRSVSILFQTREYTNKSHWVSPHGCGNSPDSNQQPNQEVQTTFERIERIKKPNRISSDWAGITLDILGVYLTGPGSETGRFPLE
jgi:hypothetical protein